MHELFCDNRGGQYCLCSNILTAKQKQICVTEDDTI